MKWTQRLTNFFATSLQRKLLLVVTVVVTLVMIAFGFYLVDSQRRTASTELEDRATRTADLLAQTTALPLWNIDTASIEAQFKAVIADPEVSSVDIYETGKSEPTVTSVQKTAAVDPITRKAEIILQRGAEQTSLGIVQIVYTRELLYRSLNQTQTLIGFIIMALILLLVISIYFVVGRLVTNPLHEMAALTNRVSAGDYTGRVNLTSRDEMSRLASAFNTMTAQLRDLISGLEQRVAARTEQLRASAEVGRTVTSIVEPDQLLKQVVDLITERFGFYYIAVFIVDESGQTAVLRAATGEAGQALLERHHQLAIDEKSMVGSAITTNSARIALDVGQGAVRFANPLLPNTRSEIALPLRVGERAIGALDAQSDQAGAFDEAYAQVLQAMADQIAVALFNAEIFNRSQRQAQTLGLLNQLSRELSLATSLEDIATAVDHTLTDMMGQQMISLAQTTANPQFASLRLFTHDATQPVGEPMLTRTTNSMIAQCLEQGSTIYTPDLGQVADRYHDLATVYRLGVRSTVTLVLRVGQRDLGTLNISSQQVDAYTPEQITQLEQVASQVAVTIENLNLAEQTQQTLAELNAANRQLISQAWDQYTRTTKLVAAEWRGGQWTVSSDRTAPLETARAVVPAPQVLSLPIKVRGTTIGEFHITATDTELAWDAEEKAFAQSLIDQVGQVLENARLIEETERLAQREKAVADAADKIHRSTNIEGVLQSAVAELQRITGRNGISVQLGFGRANQADSRSAGGDR